MAEVLVTGGGGYIGSAVVDELLKRGHKPIVYDIFLWGGSGLHGLEDKIEIIEGDIRNSRDLVYALEKVDSVIHLAGIVGAPACANNPKAHYTTNVESARTLVNCMTDPELKFVKNLIFCSSCSVYGNVAGIYEEVTETTSTMPLSSYADGKLRAEQIILQKAKEVPQFSPTIMRLTTIFGWSLRPRLDLVTNQFVYKAYKDKKITIFGDGCQYRSLIHVKDVASALVTAMEAPNYMRNREIFHIGEENNNVLVRDIAQYVKKCLPETEVEFLEQAQTDRRDYRISCKKIKNMLNWKAKYTVEDGIKELVERLKSRDFDPESPQWRNNNFNYI